MTFQLLPSKKGGIDTIPSYIIGILLAIPFLFIGVNLYASMSDGSSRSAQDLDVIIDRVSELNHLSSRSIVLHHMEQRRDFLVFMNSSEEFSVVLSKNNFLGQEREGPRIRFRPEGCREGDPCVCIFKNADLRDNPVGEVYPRITLCRPLPYNFYSGPIPVMTSFSEDDILNFESYDIEQRNSMAAAIVQESEDLEFGEAARTFGIGGAVGGTLGVVKIGAAVIIGTGGAVLAIPAALVGLAAVGVHNGVLGFTGEEYTHVFVDKEDVVIYTNQYDDTTFIQVFVKREGDYLVTCPIHEYCDNLISLIQSESTEVELDESVLN